MNGELATSSPTTARVGRNLTLQLAAAKGWKPWTADVKAAYLQSNPQDRSLHVCLPADAAQLIGIAANGTIMKLNKPMYGLADAPSGSSEPQLTYEDWDYDSTPWTRTFS